MAVDFKDYYATLGVPRTASAEEIKKSFRKLARQYHPDVAKDKKAAEAKFKEINEAHEVLSDPEKRRRYDELGADWQQGGMPRGPRGGGGMRGHDPEVHFGGTGFSDFFEQFFGGRGSAGSGRSSTSFEEMLRQAQGGASGGRVRPTPGEEVEGDILVTLDEALNGSSRQISLRRTNTRTGADETETFTVRIPPGAREGRRIRVPGRGGPGHHGGPAGDLYLRVRFAAHPDFEARGSDLYHELDLSPWEAVLGTQAVVPTLSGTVKVSIPPGTNTGRQLRVRGHGLPTGPAAARGDLYVVANVRVPETVTLEERLLWQKIAETSKFDPRRD